MFVDIEQNTDDWLKLRLGKFTSSMFKDIMAKKSTQAYKNAIYKIVYERLTEEITDSYSSEWMERGKLLEPEAKLWYELNYTDVSNGGFFYTDWTGSSPDGLISKDGMLEIKCPKYTTQIQYLVDNKLPNAYKWQIQGQLKESGREWVQFLSYHPKLKPFLIKVFRDDEMIKSLSEQLEESIKEAKQVINMFDWGYKN